MKSCCISQQLFFLYLMQLQLSERWEPLSPLSDKEAIALMFCRNSGKTNDGSRCLHQPLSMQLPPYLAAIPAKQTMGVAASTNR